MNQKPNVILMFVDDLGYGDISAFNPEGKIHTSNIDRLASEGMSFTDSHACSALCTPSRYGLLTGRYNWRSRMKYLVLPGDSMPLIEKDRMTMAQMFKSCGYHTAAVGKWHLGLEWQLNPDPKPSDFGEDPKWYEGYQPRTTQEPTADISKAAKVQGLDIDFSKPITWGPNQYGFDYFFGLPASLDQPPFVYVENDHVLEAPDHVSGQQQLDRSGASQQQLWERGPVAPHFDHKAVLDDMQNKVLSLIDGYADDDRPFFLYYPTPAVHGPLLPNDRFAGSSGLNAYADVVLQVDDMVRQISEKLEEKGLADNTIFIFTSDNGCSGVADYPFLVSHGHNPSYHFRGKKSSLYEGGHRVPTIVRWPSVIEAGTVCDHNVCHTDFFRTFADILGVRLPDGAAEDSWSNLDLWRGGDDCGRQATVYSGAMGFFSVVDHNWKLICAENGGEGPKFAKAAFTKTPVETDFELFDLSRDISETTSVLQEHPETADRLKAELDRCLVNGRSTPGAKQENHIPPYPWVQINWRG